MPTLTEEKEQSTPDLVQTAWRTEERLRSVEAFTAPNSTDLQAARFKIDEMVTELHDVKVEVMALTQEHRSLALEVRAQGFDLRHMKTEIHALTHGQRRMGAEITEMKSEITGMKGEITGMKGELALVKVSLGVHVDHFGLTVPALRGDADPQ
jgi:chromosome segregation ATPase